MTAMARANYIKKKFYATYKNLDRAVYDAEKRRLQAQLLNLQLWAIDNKKRVAIAVEGRDAAGKGGTIKRFVEYLMPKYLRVVELGVPTKNESRNWFLRYEKQMPKKGEIVFFDRSWYNRAGVEPVMGFWVHRKNKPRIR